MKRISIIAGLALFFAVMLDGMLSAQSTDWVYIGPQATVALPGTSVVVRYVTFSDENNAPARLFKVPLNVRLDWLRKGRYSLSSSDFSMLPLTRVTTPVLKRASTGITATADFGALPNGHYLAVWQHGAVLGGRLTEVGSLGTVWHTARSTLLVYPVDLRSMRRRSDVQYALWRGDSHADMVTLRGLAWLHGMIGSDAVLYGRASDGSETLQRIWANTVAGNTGYVQTDRPIYRTGQRVYVRAVLRSGGIGNYVVPHGTVHVIVRSPDGTNIYDRQRLLSAFGTVSADFQLPESARLGYYNITVENIGAGFSVEQYKKPEYSLHAAPANPYVIGGRTATFAVEAKYFFGAPAAGMNVHYIARSNRQWVWQYDPYTRLMPSAVENGENPHTVDASRTADINGRLSITIPTKHVENEESLSLAVDGRDASGRTVSTATAMRIVPASFWIGAAPDRWYAQAGDDVTLSASAKSYEGTPRPGTALHIEIHGTRWGYKDHRETDVPARAYTLVTDGRGVAALRWHPDQAASYEIRLSATDENGNTARSKLWYWVSDPNTAFWYPNQQIAMIPDKEHYRPGEHPKLLISVPATDADGLLIVSNDQIRSAKIIHIGAKAQTVAIDSPKDATNYVVRLEVPQKTGMSVGEAWIRVVPPPPLLKVTLTPDKAKYAPGERATFGVRVRKTNGAPVRAELGIGIVDQALYAVQAENRTSAMSAFYDNQNGYVAYEPSWSFIQNEIFVPRSIPVSTGLKEIGAVTPRGQGDLVRSGVTSDVFSASYSSLQGVAVRSFFPDTAYWKPDIVTDGEGNASFSFTWPDTLTIWHASGEAIDMKTSVGAGTQDTLVTKDFLVRLEMPRFLRRGDHSQFTGIANGKPGATSTLMRLDAGDLLASGSAEQSAALDSNSTGNAAWNITPLTSLGDRAITLTGSNGTLSDAMRLSIPIEAAGAAEHVRDSAEAHDRSSLDLRLPEMYDAGSLQIRLSPSVLASLLQNVRMLDVFPFYCTEQTMSAALPSVFLDRVLKRAGITLPKDSPATAVVVKHAVARLGDLQHADGSWGWWEHDDAHPFMTAYALYGLAEFRKSGFAVPQSMYDRGIASLLNQLQGANSDTLRLWGGAQPGSQWNTRAFMLYALADAAPQRMDRAMLAQTMEHAGALNDYALAVLGLAQHRLHDDEAARALLDRLNGHMLQAESYAYWLGQTWHYAWQDDPIETTAYALRLNAALEPGSDRTKKIVNYLRVQQRGSWWYTTKDTAAAVYAIAEAARPGSDEFHPDASLNVYVDQKLVRHLHITNALLNGAESVITVPAAQMQQGANVRFDVSGTGLLYWSTDWTRYAPPFARKVADADASILSRLHARAPSFSIDRKYEARRWPWQVGDEVTVDTMVRVASDVDYVAVEDPFPAGVEYQPDQGEGSGNNWSGLQFFDDRVVFFADRLNAEYPLHLRYTLRVTTPGTYTASPPIAYAMYGPPVTTVGQPDKITVR